jgi:hypothetical protein
MPVEVDSPGAREVRKPGFGDAIQAREGPRHEPAAASVGHGLLDRAVTPNCIGEPSA